jgi:hypothetical protein
VGVRNEKVSKLATGGSWYNMFSWSLFPILSTRLSLLLVFPRSLRYETSHSSCGWSSSGSVRCVYSLHRKVEANRVVLASSHNCCYRSIALGLPRFKLLFQSVAELWTVDSGCHPGVWHWYCPRSEPTAAIGISQLIRPCANLAKLAPPPKP